MLLPLPRTRSSAAYDSLCLEGYWLQPAVLQDLLQGRKQRLLSTSTHPIPNTNSLNHSALRLIRAKSSSHKNRFFPSTAVLINKIPTNMDSHRHLHYINVFTSVNITLMRIFLFQNIPCTYIFSILLFLFFCIFFNSIFKCIGSQGIHKGQYRLRR